jgi:hypothetical protein
MKTRPDVIAATQRQLDSPVAAFEIAAAFARRFSQTPDAHAVTWDSESGDQVDEIDQIIAAVRFAR